MAGKYLIDTNTAIDYLIVVTINEITETKMLLTNFQRMKLK
jgi:hypothetical protein